MYWILVVFCVINTHPTKCSIENSIYNLTDKITKLLNNGTNERIAELKTKIETINKFTLNADKLSTLLLDIAKQSLLNQTNFYNALDEKDHFRLVSNGSKNLYLKLKEKLNRDDVLKIVKERGNVSSIVTQARRMEEFQHGTNEEVINEVVDKLLAEVPIDNHVFDAKANLSGHWDPQSELNDLKEHHQHNARRIFKGERTTIRYYPFMVSVHVVGRFWCGGVIYWYDLVLTSASCLQLMHNNRFFRENPRSLSVRVGSNHSRVGGEQIEALEVYFHPGYNPRTLRNNIVVIRLHRKLSFSHHRTPKMIAISHASHPIPSTAEILLLGWGVTKISQKMAYEPIYLQRKFLPVYPNYFCKEVYGSKFIAESMFCAGTMSTGEGACDHDAGGPAILAGKLVGIISFGPALCGAPNTPTVFTTVGYFADWIETVNESMPEYYRGKARTTTTTANPLIDFFNTWEPAGLTHDPAEEHKPIMSDEEVQKSVVNGPEIELEESINLLDLETTSEPTVVVRGADTDNEWSAAD